MKPVLRANWNLTPRQAMRLQERLREQVVREDRLDRLQFVAGGDIAFDPETDRAFAGVIIYRLPGLEEVERRSACRRLRFPYVPGLLSFRESPVLLAAFRLLETEPDAILVDGHGLAHPRRFGIACHLGVLLDKPTIGCAKSLLVGEHPEPRTRDRVKPLYVTQGHRVSLRTAVEIVKRCLDGFRIPKPTREADHYVRHLRQEYQRTLRPAESRAVPS